MIVKVLVARYLAARLNRLFSFCILGAWQLGTSAVRKLLRPEDWLAPKLKRKPVWAVVFIA